MLQNTDDIYVDKDLITLIEEQFSFDYILHKDWNSDRIVGALCLRGEILQLLHKLYQEQEERRYNN